MRKLHSQESGYIAERMNPYVKGKKVVIYIASEQGIDTADHKYAVVCDAHATIGEAKSIPTARHLMKNPDEFCLDCRSIVSPEEATPQTAPQARSINPIIKSWRH